MIYSLRLIFTFAVISQFILQNVQGHSQPLTADIIDCSSGMSMDGSIDLTISGGVSPYSFEWNKTGDPNYSAETEDIDMLSVGEYCVTVTDDLCGTATSCFTVEICVLQLNSVIENESCGGSDGSIVLSGFINGIEVQNMIVQWDNGMTGSEIFDLTSGIYCADVSTSNPDPPCITSDCFFVGSIGNPEIILNDIVNISECSDGRSSCDGLIDISFDINCAPFFFSWTGPNGFQATTEDIENLCSSGQYTVTIRDERGVILATQNFVICCCESDGSIFQIECAVEGPGILISDAILMSPTTGSSKDGSIIPIVLGDGPYTQFLWTLPDGSTSTAQSLYNLGPGTYCLTVRSPCGEDSECWTLVDCSISGLKVILVSVEPACINYQVGSILIEGEGGTAPYEFNWGHGSSEQYLQNLSGGFYCVTITDASGCTSDLCVEVEILNSNRIDCDIYCGSQLIVDQDKYFVWDQNDCRIRHWYCDDGYYLESENVGLQDPEIVGCNLVIKCFNEEIFHIDYGYQCRDCIFGITPFNDVVGCWVDYCYIPWSELYASDITYIAGFQEFNSVSVITVGENPCLYKQVTLYNDCLIGDPEILTYQVSCGSPPGYQDIDCSQLWEIGVLYSGMLDNCDGQIVSHDSIPILRQYVQEIGELENINVGLDKISTHRDYISYLDSLKIIVNEFINCTDLHFVFISGAKGDSRIDINIIDNQGNIRNHGLSSEVIAGLNRIYLKNVLHDQDSIILLEVITPDMEKLYGSGFRKNCQWKNKSELPDNSEMLAHPNPFNGTFTVELKNNNFDGEFSIYNSLGEIFFIRNYEDKNNIRSINLDANLWSAGIYYLYYQEDKGISRIMKVVKY